MNNKVMTTGMWHAPSVDDGYDAIERQETAALLLWVIIAAVVAVSLVVLVLFQSGIVH